MEKNYNNLNLFKIEIDSRNMIGILEKTLYYEKEDFLGELEEVEIPLENIKKIKYTEKKVDTGKTKSNLIGDFLLTILDSGAHPTTVEYKKPTITIEYLSKDKRGTEYLKIENKLLTKEIYENLKRKVESEKEKN